MLPQDSGSSDTADSGYSQVSVSQSHTQSLAAFILTILDDQVTQDLEEIEPPAVEFQEGEEQADGTGMPDLVVVSRRERDKPWRVELCIEAKCPCVSTISIHSHIPCHKRRSYCCELIQAN